jgi:hypothetical protein
MARKKITAADVEANAHLALQRLQNRKEKPNESPSLRAFRDKLVTILEGYQGASKLSVTALTALNQKTLALKKQLQSESTAPLGVIGIGGGRTGETDWNCVNACNASYDECAASDWGEHDVPDPELIGAIIAIKEAFCLAAWGACLAGC